MSCFSFGNLRGHLSTSRSAPSTDLSNKSCSERGRSRAALLVVVGSRRIENLSKISHRRPEGTILLLLEPSPEILRKLLETR